MRPWFRRPTEWFDRGTSAFVLLALAMLVPMTIALWLVNETVATQSAAARQSVLESYRGQLRLVRARVDAHWQTHATRLNGFDDPSRRFAELALGGMADGAVLFDDDGAVVFPDDAVGPNRAAAAIEQQLAAIERAAPATRQPHVDRVAGLLNDYTVALAASERLALMERLRAIVPNVVLPTEAALRLSMALRRSVRPAPPAHFQPTAVRDVWAITSSDARTVALYWTGRLESMMHDVLHEVAPAGIRFLAFPPDLEADPEAIAAGASLPGWQLTFQPLARSSFDAAGRRQAIVYAAVAGGGLAVMAVLGIAAGRAFRRHLRMARLKTDLVAAVSHELRTPLASMRVLVDGLLADDELDAVKTREYLQLLSTEQTRLTRLVDSFLTFARLERGRQQFTFMPTPPSAIVAAAAEAIADRLPAPCDFRVAIEPDLPPVVADREALVTAVVNLLDNALKYTPADKRIVLRAERDRANGVAFVVDDNGIGIPARERRPIFRRFYRVDERLTRETGGVGLGLSIVEQIVRAHGGSVDVRSDNGAGSTFTLRLPSAGDGAAV